MEAYTTTDEEKRKRCSGCGNYKAVLHFLKQGKPPEFSTCQSCRGKGRARRQQSRTKASGGITQFSRSPNTAIKRLLQPQNPIQKEATHSKVSILPGPTRVIMLILGVNSDYIRQVQHHDTESETSLCTKLHKPSAGQDLKIGQKPISASDAVDTRNYQQTRPLHENRRFSDDETQWIVKNSPGGTYYRLSESWTDRTIRFNLVFKRNSTKSEVRQKWIRSVFETDMLSESSGTQCSRSSAAATAPQSPLTGDGQIPAPSQS